MGALIAILCVWSAIAKLSDRWAAGSVLWPMTASHCTPATQQRRSCDKVPWSHGPSTCSFDRRVAARHGPRPARFLSNLFRVSTAKQCR
eukprot:3633016-Rhodomonas_salina.6